MNTPPANEAAGQPLHNPDEAPGYTLDLVAELTGISSQTILHYQQQGLVKPAATTGHFDDEALYALRRIEQLRSTYETNLPGLKLILDLMDEVDRLNAALRARR